MKITFILYRDEFLTSIQNVKVSLTLSSYVENHYQREIISTGIFKVTEHSLIDETTTSIKLLYSEIKQVTFTFTLLLLTIEFKHTTPLAFIVFCHNV